jgi:hypothetical protein
MEELHPGKNDGGRIGKTGRRWKEGHFTTLYVGASATEVNDTTLAMTGLTASATELNQYAINLDIADGSADADYYVVCPHAGDVAKIYSVIDGTVGTADITLTPYIGATPITNGAITITQSGSGAGDIDSATPTAANTVTAGQAIKFTVAGGGSGGSPRIHLTALITR